MTRCLFCEFVNGEGTVFTIWEDRIHMAFLDANPINPGHTILIPKKHTSDILDLSEKEYSDLLIIAKRISIQLKKLTNAKRMGIAVEGFGIPHVHIHLVPVNKGMELNPTRAKKASLMELEIMLKKLKSRPIVI